MVLPPGVTSVTTRGYTNTLQPLSATISVALMPHKRLVNLTEILLHVVVNGSHDPMTFPFGTKRSCGMDVFDIGMFFFF